MVPTASSSGQTNIYGPVAALPFGTSIGSNVVSTLISSNDTWWQGYSDSGGQYGDHANDVGYVVSDEIVGDPPVVSADAAGKEGVMAFKLYLNNQPHFGYVHFDFRPPQSVGFGGVIVGYAYETQAGVPIVAQRLGDGPLVSDGLITAFQPVNGYQLTWNAVSGGTYRLQMSTNLVTWVDASGDLLANQNSVTFIAAKPSTGQSFYRVRRMD